MGSALAIVAAANNDVSLVGSPLDDNIIDNLGGGKPHPGLKVQVPENVMPIKSDDTRAAMLQKADVVVIGVSSPGVAWALDKLKPVSYTHLTLPTKA